MWNDSFKNGTILSHYNSIFEFKIYFIMFSYSTLFHHMIDWWFIVTYFLQFQIFCICYLQLPSCVNTPIDLSIQYELKINAAELLLTFFLDMCAQALQLVHDGRASVGAAPVLRCQMCLRTDALQVILERLAVPGRFLPLKNVY